MKRPRGTSRSFAAFSLYCVRVPNLKTDYKTSPVYRNKAFLVRLKTRVRLFPIFSSPLPSRGVAYCVLLIALGITKELLSEHKGLRQTWEQRQGMQESNKVQRALALSTVGRECTFGRKNKTDNLYRGKNYLKSVDDF